jgi:SAM-dependent methyltransferase
MNQTATSLVPDSGTSQASRKGFLGLYAITIFLSAFLLFQVEPLIAKLILPWFGGSAAVWVSCMLFFQIALLLGYGYAHFLVRSVPLSRQATVHVVLLVLGLCTLPILPNPGWKPAGNEDPLFRIMGLLAVTVGLPYMLLSSTSPLLQSWYSRSREGGMPYRFFALSNLGSMIALLSYPVLVEPYLSNQVQAWAWSGGFVAFAGCCVAVALMSRKGHLEAPAMPEDDVPAPHWSVRLLWMALSAVASAMLLAITNHMTQNVAAIPFLWILPLSIYLLTFILCFDSPRWYSRIVFLPLFAAGLGSLAWFITTQETPDKLIRALAFLSLALFVICMVCHGELARLKPHASHLTGFYLRISVGGAIGGLFVAFLAPRIFNANYELPILVCACAFLALGVFWRELGPMNDKEKRTKIWWGVWAVAGVLSLVMAGYLFKSQRSATGGSRLMVRNFYGSLRVSDILEEGIPVRQLSHGTIDHGEQIMDILRHRWPTTYYGPNSGVGLSIKMFQAKRPVRIGVIGLGTGTLSTYARQGDYCRMYDINPLVLDIARTQFSFVPQNPGKVDIVLGDARLSLEKEAPQNFDVLAVDAFSSDSIPIHLLTREAFQIYWRHMKPDGILAVHVSNRYLDLEPIVHLAAESMGKHTAFIDSDEDDSADVFSSDWVLVAGDAKVFDTEPLKSAKSEPSTRRKIRMWTDDYSNLWQILK